MIFLYPKGSRHVAARAPRRLRVVDYERPKTRGDCLPGGMNEQRPCPYVGCRHHTATEVMASGLIRVNVSDAWLDGRSETGGLDAMQWTCSLDAAEQGGMGLEEVGETMGVVRERIRQIQEQGLRSIRRKAPHILEGGSPDEPTSSYRHHHRQAHASAADWEYESPLPDGPLPR